MTTKTTKKKVSKKTTSKKKVVKKAPAKRKVGRPTKYEERFCDMVIEKMSEGYSKEACAGYIGVSKNTFYQWVEAHPEFKDSVSIGETRSQLHWEETLVNYKVHTKNGKQINGQVFNLNMKNRFGWTDKKEVKNEEVKKEKKSFSFTLDSEPEENHD